jgi:hypothetical protein
MWQVLIDLTGQRFGRLTAVSRVPHVRKTATRWNCVCDCGKRVIVRRADLRYGGTRSCGCFRDEKARAQQTTHGKTKTLEYSSFRAIKSRCLKTTSKDYPRYGGSGIKLHPAWVKDFEAFLAHVGPRPTPKHSIERINVRGNYEPGNVRWATAKEQANNRTNTIYVTFRGERLSLLEAVAKSGTSLCYGTIKHRVTHGWNAEAALLTPRLRKQKRATQNNLAGVR